MRIGTRNILLGLIGAGLLGFILFEAATDNSTSQKGEVLSQGIPLESENQASGKRADEISICFRELQTQTNANQKLTRLSALRQFLCVMPLGEMSQAIQTFLNSKQDVSTGARFKPGKGGVLEEAPTFRTFLLDGLGQRDPASAAAYAKVVFTNSDSADEWAVSLRNLAIGDTNAAARHLLEEKTRELFHNEKWLQNPSAGYCEAFDSAVYLGGTNLIPDLANLLRNQSNEAVRHAAFLALDRLTVGNPAEALGVLGRSEMLEGLVDTRAYLFARADIRESEQRGLLEDYLLNAKIGVSELNTFAHIYPNDDFTISDNLLTPRPTSKLGDLKTRDAEFLKVVTAWLDDTRFHNVHAQLEWIQSRLTEYVRQEGG